MKRNTLFYLVSFSLLLVIFLFFNKAYKELMASAELANRANTIYSNFEGLSKQINNAAISTPGLKKDDIFYADGDTIIKQIGKLKNSVLDTANVRITKALDQKIRTEIDWILKSNVPDSIVNSKVSEHIATFKSINMLIKEGIKRNLFLHERRKNLLDKAIKNVNMWMILFIIGSGVLLCYTTFDLFRQRSKTDQKESELLTALNRINDSVISLDNNWRYTYLNEHALAVHPWGKESVLGKTIWEVNPTLRDTPFREKYEEAMRTREVVEIEEYYPPYDVWYFLKIYPSADGLTIFYKDISKTKRAERSLVQSLKETEGYKYALDESAIVAITDQKGIIKHVNDNFCKISKYNREALIGQDHRIINSGYHSKEFIRELWVTIANGKIWTGDLKNKAKDGTTYWVETTIVPFLDEKGKPYQYIAIRADITQRKLAEEQLSKNLEDLERSNKELEQFAYIASHDLQEPLRMVGSYMQLIARRYKGKLDDDADEFINFAIDGALRMKQLIADLLNYSRLNRDGELEVININDIMDEVKQNLAASIQENNGTITYTDLPLIRADKTQMVQLFQNLVSNALKFKKEGVDPVINIKAGQQGDKNWLFSVSDNGIGIESQYAEKVFVIFKQLHSKLKYNGTGIGLAIVKKIVEKHGGNIWFTSEAGTGTTFHFTLNLNYGTSSRNSPDRG